MTISIYDDSCAECIWDYSNTFFAEYMDYCATYFEESTPLQFALHTFEDFKKWSFDKYGFKVTK